MKLFPDALPDAVTLELPEDIVNRGARRKQAGRQIPPRTARAQEVENRVHRRAHVGLARPPSAFRRRNQRLQTLPLRITQIAGNGRSRLLVGRSMRLRPHPESKPPSHLGGGESRAANPRYKLLGQALSLCRKWPQFDKAVGRPESEQWPGQSYVRSRTRQASPAIGVALTNSFLYSIKKQSLARLERHESLKSRCARVRFHYWRKFSRADFPRPGRD